MMDDQERYSEWPMEREYYELLARAEKAEAEVERLKSLVLLLGGKP